MSNFYPNQDQQEHMEYLNSIPPEERCYKSKTHADRVAEHERLRVWAKAHNEAESHSSVSNGHVVWCKECNPSFPRGKIIQSLRDWKD